MQDIIPKDKRSIRNIPLDQKVTPDRAISVPKKHAATTRVAHEKKVESEYHFEDDSQQSDDAFYERKTIKKFTKILVVSAIVLFILVIVGGYALLYSSAEITIQPKVQAINITSNIQASTGSDKSSALNFSVIAMEEKEQFTVTATGDETVSIKAKGIITVSNNYSKAAQKLIANTRFQSKEGNIYRISDAVSIPGQKTVAGKLVPGTLDVNVTADAAGQVFNTGNTTFTIPGFKNDPRYSKFTAIVKNSIVGGYSGTRKKVSTTEVTAKTSDAVVRLKAKIVAETANKLGTSSVAALTYFEVKDPTQTSTSDTTVITQIISAHIITLNIEELSKILIEQSGISTDRTMVSVRDFSGITFDVSKASTKPWIDPVLNLVVKGKADAVWFYNPEKLAQDLAGTPKKDLTLVLSKYAGIQEAEAIVRPFWKNTFPQKAHQINIKEK